MKKLILSLAIALTALAAGASLPQAQEAIAGVKKQFAPDTRVAVFDVTAAEDGGKIIVTGKVDNPAAAKALDDALRATGDTYTLDITTLPSDLWATPKLSVVHMRTAPGHASEMATQALMGMPLRLLEEQNGWARVQTPDAYIGWVSANGLVRMTPEQMDQWRTSPRMVVTAPFQVQAYNSATATGLRDVVTDLLNGDIVVRDGAGTESGRIRIKLPDGRIAWAAADALTPIEIWAAQDFNPDKILDTAYSMEGTPYFWGGTSIKHLDCSGLAKVAYLSNGIILMRDASQQALTGGRIEAKDWRTCQSGDLLFFGNAKTGRVTHVAIYDRDGNYVHSSGQVKRNSVDPEAESYLTTPFLHATRIHGYEGTPGITLARNHPWYFNK